MAKNNLRISQEGQSWADEMFFKIAEAFENEDFEMAIKIAELVLEEDNLEEEEIRVAKWSKALGFYRYAFQLLEEENTSFLDSKNRQAFDTLSKAEDLFYEFGNEYGWDEDVFYYVMEIKDSLEKAIETRNTAICLIDSEKDDYWKTAYDYYSKWTDLWLSEHSFTEEVQYCNRKYVFIGKDIQKIGGTYQWFNDERVIDWIFTLDQLPSDMVFPLGRPRSGLFMAHPVLTNHYYPMETAEEKLFMEKVMEFCWLVQCLGATRVSFHSDKGLTVSQGMGSKSNYMGNAGIRKVNVGGEYSSSKDFNENNYFGQNVELVQRFTPKNQAYCPDDLVWLDSDPQWKMLIKQRLKGGIMEYNYRISSSETCQMSSNETNEVKANFEFIMAKVNGSYDSSTDRTFSKSEETEWSIHVEFASLEELAKHKPSRKNDDESQIGFTDTEQDYLDMVKDCLEDGEIGIRERKLLDKIRVKNGISEERAKELEATLSTPQLTDNEKEYLEAFRDACEDGKVSDKQHRLLEKLRVMHGISEERAKEIELF